MNVSTYDWVQRDETTTVSLHHFFHLQMSTKDVGFGYKVVSVNPSYTQETVVYRFKDATDKFLDKLQEEYNAITIIKAEVKTMTDVDENEF